MNKPSNTASESEIIAYTYQVAQDFEEYLTPATSIIIEPRNPAKVAKKLKNSAELSEDFVTPAHCYTIVLEEQGSKIIGYGFGKDPFTAIREAKSKVMKQIDEIQDELISNKDRLNEINSLFNNTTKH